MRPPDPQLVAQVVAALLADRGGVQHGDEVQFRCLYPVRHAHGDADPSASFSTTKGAWLCHVCGAKGSVRMLARALGLVPAGGAQTETARWVLRDPDGTPVAVHIRLEPGKKAATKDCVWARPGGVAGLGGRKLKTLPLYGCERLKDHPGARVVVTEGEKARDALTARSILAVGTVTGSGGTPSDDVLRVLTGREVILWCDADTVGRDHMHRIATRLRALGITRRTIDPWPDRTDGSDAADFTGTDDELRALLNTPEDTMATTPDSNDADAPPVDLADLLDQVERELRRHVVFASDAQVVATALWIAHAHAIEAFDVTPYLNPRSVEKRSGKTRLVEVANELVPSPWMTTMPSEAVLYRKIAATSPTLLLDEVDAIFRGPPSDRTEGLRAMLNSGHRRGVTVSRCAGPKMDELREFEVFCPKVLAGIGRLPDTVSDRCVPIVLRRKKPGEVVARFRQREFALVAAPIRAGLAQWAAGALDVLRAARPVMPEELHDRASEVAEPLVAIADLVGGEWPARVRAALVALFGEVEDASANVQLLGAICDVFTERNTDRILTGDLLAALVARENEPWAGWWARDVAQAAKDRTTPRKAAMELARHLKDFGVTPKLLRTAAHPADNKPVARGYFLEDFRDAFSRYLPQKGPEVVTAATTVAAQGVAGPPEVVTPPGCNDLPADRKPLVDVAGSDRNDLFVNTRAGADSRPPLYASPLGPNLVPADAVEDDDLAEVLDP